MWGGGINEKPLWSMTGRCSGKEEMICLPYTEIMIEMRSEYVQHGYLIYFFYKKVLLS